MQAQVDDLTARMSDLGGKGTAADAAGSGGGSGAVTLEMLEHREFAEVVRVVAGMHVAVLTRDPHPIVVTEALGAATAMFGRLAKLGRDQEQPTAEELSAIYVGSTNPDTSEFTEMGALGPTLQTLYVDFATQLRNLVQGHRMSSAKAVSSSRHTGGKHGSSGSTATRGDLSVLRTTLEASSALCVAAACCFPSSILINPAWQQGVLQVLLDVVLEVALSWGHNSELLAAQRSAYASLAGVIRPELFVTSVRGALQHCVTFEMKQTVVTALPAEVVGALNLHL